MSKLIESADFIENPLEQVCYNFQSYSSDKSHEGDLKVLDFLTELGVECTINFNRVTNIVWIEVIFKGQVVMQVDQHLSVDQFIQTLQHLTHTCFFKGLTIVDEYWWLNVKHEELLFMLCLAYPKIFENFKRNEENYDEYDFDDYQEVAIENEIDDVKQIDSIKPRQLGQSEYVALEVLKATFENDNE